MSSSRVLRAPGTSLYHLVPKHLRTTWSRPEQSHLIPEACYPNGTDNRRQRQRQPERPLPEPSDILKRFYALYDWKKAIITPKFKKGQPSLPSNYRPIALTCTCCKILEKIIANELILFLKIHNLIDKQQHGFLKFHSTFSTHLMIGLFHFLPVIVQQLHT